MPARAVALLTLTVAEIVTVRGESARGAEYMNPVPPVPPSEEVPQALEPVNWFEV